MKILAFSAGVWFALAAMGCVDNIKSPPYKSRYEKWLPHSTSLVVMISIGGIEAAPSSGLWTAAFTASPDILREPEARRCDGTFVTGFAQVTEQEMKTMLKIVDRLGKSSNFSTSGGGKDWYPPEPEQAHVGVVWGRSSTYDWCTPAKGKMRDVLKQLHKALTSKEAVDVMEGLIDGHNQRQ